jgi:hypothetical protein
MILIGGTLGRQKFRGEKLPYSGLWFGLKFNCCEIEALMVRVCILLSFPDLLSGI